MLKIELSDGTEHLIDAMVTTNAEDINAVLIYLPYFKNMPSSKPNNIIKSKKTYYENSFAAAFGKDIKVILIPYVEGTEKPEIRGLCVK